MLLMGIVKEKGIFYRRKDLWDKNGGNWGNGLVQYVFLCFDVLDFDLIDRGSNFKFWRKDEGTITSANLSLSVSFFSFLKSDVFFLSQTGTSTEFKKKNICCIVEMGAQ